MSHAVWVVPKRVASAANAILNSSYRTIQPVLSTYPFLTTNPEFWGEGAGPLTDLRDAFWEKVCGCRDRDMLTIERQFFDWKIRNYISEDLRRAYVAKINFRPKAQLVPSVDVLKRALKILGYGNTREVLPIYRVRPSNYEASNGVDYDSINDRLFTGPKGPVWPVVLNSANTLYERVIMDSRLTWDISPNEAIQVLCDYAMWAVPFFRHDNPHSYKPRLLWGVPSRSYVLQMHLVWGLRCDMLNSVHYAHTCSQIATHLQRLRLEGDHERFLSLDLTRYDLTQAAALMWNIRRAVAELYNYSDNDTRLAVFNAIVNVYIPLILEADPKTGQLLLQLKFGIAPSGTGDFPFYNTILLAIINMLSLIEVDSRYQQCVLDDLTSLDIGINSGDNSVVPTDVGPLVWARQLSKYGLQLKTAETMSTTTVVPLLRVMYDLELGGWEPSAMSIAWKAVTPIDTSLSWDHFEQFPTGYGISRRKIHNRIFALKYALGNRTRHAILASTIDDALNSTKQAASKQMCKFFRRYIAPIQFYRLDLTDTEISRELIELGCDQQSIDDVYQSKHKFGISDTLNYL